ncbi:MAG: large conductance mechanosensitive channel protein MscL [Pelistega sp.]|nr:large conductance mechanosensitive channel protein MscL [Pelistega sp.]
MSKGFLKEFQEFAVKGNMVDLAVGVIIGAAFGKIIDSLVKDIIMPFVNFIIGGEADFSNKFIVLSQPEGYAGEQTLTALREAGATVFAYGNFITVLINFVLLAFVVFLIVKSIAKARARFEAEKAADPDPEDIVLLREIRDSLKK